MTTTMDVVVCLDCSSSMASDLESIRSSIHAILGKALVCHQGDVRMALIKFQSHSDHWITKVYPFTSSIDIFQQRINAVQPEGKVTDEDKAIVDALDICLTLDWRSKDAYVDRSYEKLVILVTNGPPCGLLNNRCPCRSRDLWRLSHALGRIEITLVVVGIGPGDIVYRLFYHALANNTGGEYLSLLNAQPVLLSVIARAIQDQEKISELLHLRVTECSSMHQYTKLEQDACTYMRHCTTMLHVQEVLYWYCKKRSYQPPPFPLTLLLPPSSPASMSLSSSSLWYRDWCMIVVGVVLGAILTIVLIK